MPWRGPACGLRTNAIGSIVWQVTLNRRTAQLLLAAVATAITLWVVLTAAIEQMRRPGPADWFVRGEVELLATVAAILLAALVLRPAVAALVLLLVGAVQLLSGLIAGVAWAPIAVPLLWSGLAAIGSGCLAAIQAPRAFLVIPVGLVLGIGYWFARVIFT